MFFGSGKSWALFQAFLLEYVSSFDIVPKFLTCSVLHVSFSLCFSLCNFYLCIFKFTDSFLGCAECPPKTYTYSSRAFLTLPFDLLCSTSILWLPVQSYMLPTLSIRAVNVLFSYFKFPFRQFQHLYHNGLLLWWLFCLLAVFLAVSCAS